MSSVNKVILKRLYLKNSLSINDVARAIDLNYSATRKAMVDCGIPMRSRADGVRAARHKLGTHMVGKTRVFTEEWKNNISTSAIRRGEQTAAGFSKKASGYVEITRGTEKGKSVHVSKMEQRLGRKLLSDECVHHIDGNRSNNDDNNLALVTRSGHMRLHRREQKISRERAHNVRIG